MNGLPEHLGTIDFHNHVYPGADGRLDRHRAEALLEGSQRLGIHRICVSRPLTEKSPSPTEIRRANDVVLEAMAYHPRFVGFCFVNPGHASEAVAELQRCILGEGMRGVKLYHQHVICDPVQRPVMAWARETGVPVLMHAGKAMDRATRRRQPRLSDSRHFVRAATMFPGTVLVQAHIGGGGDWEWNLRALECRPGTYIDIGGSVVDAGMVRRTVDTVGADHVLFATDGSLEEGVGKLLDAELDEATMRLICHGNAVRLLRLGGA
ncbi:MAG: amidohydrolase [Lentisphaeria bacterium]|nr:amidohydrolase [Lentisphaeria bacterium]